MNDAEETMKSPMLGLPDEKTVPDPFRLLDKAVHWDEKQLTSVSITTHGEWWEVIEAAAQSCCLHQRWKDAFSDHVFLLSVDRLEVCCPALSGKLAITAVLSGQSSRTASYEVLVRQDDEDGQGASCELSLTVGRKAYDETLNKEVLAPHYKRYWQWLTEGR